MLILSTFNSEYLQKPLQFLVDILNKSNDLIQIEYVESKLSIHLSSLKIHKNNQEICIILLRLIDLIEDNDGNINIEQLNKNLDSVLQDLEELKKEKNMSLILFLCPSVTNSHAKELQELEEKIKQRMTENKIHLITYEDIFVKSAREISINISGEANHIPYSPGFYCEIAILLITKLYSLKPKPYKIIIVDCDNTLWGGLVGEVGWENIELKRQNLDLQQFLIDQFNQGKLIVLASKNDKKNVMEVFQNRKDMLLEEKHLVMELNEVNWNLKTSNVKKILKAANITPDHALFVDDSEEERNAVEKEEELLGIDCIDPWQNGEKLNTDLRLTTNKYLEVTETDRNRTALLRDQIASTSIVLPADKDSHINENEEYKEKIKKNIEEYHKTLEIVQVTKDDTKEIERISSLTGKTNQFNIHREPKSEEEINKFLSGEKNSAFLGRKKQGLSSVQEIGSVVLLATIGKQNLLIQVLLASCRVLARKMGDIIPLIKRAGELAFNANLAIVSIVYKKTDKNLKMCIFLNTLIKAGLSTSNELIDFNKCSEIKIDFFSDKLKELDIIKLAYTDFSNETYLKLPELEKATIENIQDTRNRRIELEKIIQSENYLLNKFFSEDEFQIIKLFSSLEKRIAAICSLSLGKVDCDISLIAQGLDSLEATVLRFRIFESEGITIPISELLGPNMTVSKLIGDMKKPRRITETITKNDDFYNRNLPSSFQQQRIWLAEQQELAENSANFHMTACYKISLEKLDMQRFKLACQELVNLYDVFGASFFMQNNKLMQLIKSPGARELSFQIRNLNTTESLEEAIQRELDKSWKMSNLSLIRFIVFKDEFENNGYIFFHIHHAIFDAISFKNCLDILSEIYKHLKFSSSYSFKNNPPQYIDYIRHQQKKSEDKVFQTEADKVWRKILGKVDGVTKFPNDISQAESKPPEQAVKRYEFSLSFEDLLALKNLAQLNSVTCFTVLYAVFALVVASYTFQKKITLITATNGREGHSSFDKMIGFFVNLLVQPFEIEENQLFAEYLKQVNEQFLASHEFQNVPTSKIQEILGQIGQGGVQGIFSSIAFIYQNFDEPQLILDGILAKLCFPEIPILFDSRDKVKREKPLFDLGCFVKEINKKIYIVIEYNPALYSELLMQGLAKNYKHSLKEVIKNPNQNLGDISVVCDEEQCELIRIGQGPKLDFSEEISLVNKFQQTVLKYPENIALSCENKRLTYKEVDQQATNLAHVLIEKGVKQGNYVGIFLDANHLFFIAELAVLKINAVFIPLSKENPNERLKLIISDANIEFIIIDNDTKGLFDTTAQTRQLISIDAIKNFVNLEKKLPIFFKNLDTFCILYTSGSTGNPKGVVLQEKGIFRVVEHPNFIKVLPGTKIAQTANHTFDAAQLECWLAWKHGASLVLFNKETILNIDLFTNKLKAENITTIWLTAPLFHFLSKENLKLFENVEFIMAGGDVVHKETIKEIFIELKNPPTIIIVYGPTENSIVTTIYIVDAKTISDYETVPIGLPINETNVEIRTPFGSKTPLGGIGELFVAGNGVAKGYLNLQELTEKRFTGGPGNRYYQTGDLVRYNPLLEVPQLMFIGRRDNQQVKINGNLVVLEEVRYRLSSHPEIIQIELSVIKIGNVNKLVAFYTSNSMDKKTIESANKMFNSFLSEHLPAYMLPSFYIQLDNFKLNANGKLDKTQFQKFESELYENFIEEILPKTQSERAILKIVKNRLYAFPNNIKTNLINFGCDSIATMEIINAINIKFKPEFEKNFEKNANVENVELDTYLNEKILHAYDLYQNPTIEALANVLIKKLHNEAKKSSLRQLKGGDSNLPFIIFIHPAGGGLSCFDKLIEQVKFDNICYGIEDPLLDSNQLKLLTMEEMARNYLSIINNQIQGPFILAGYSFGGMLALEIAAQYESINDHLLEVFLFDTWVVSCANEEIKIKLKHDVLIYCAEQRKQVNVNDGSREMITLLEELCEHHQTIGFEFNPKKLISIPVCLFKATNLNNEFSRMNMQDKSNFLLKFLDEKLFNIQEIKATHFDLLKSDLIAEYLTEIVNERNLKKCPNKCDKKINKGGQSMLFSSLNEINNDPKFSSLLNPKVK